MTRYWTLILLLSILGTITACIAEQSPEPVIAITGSPAKTNSPSPTTTPSPSAVPSPTGTSTPSPSTTLTPTSSPTPERLACWDAGGSIELGEVRTDLLPLPLSFRIYLPPCYAEIEAATYPVLYLIHGQNFNDDQWDRLGIDETADQLIADGEIPPLLIVMPRDRSWAQPSEDRFGQAVIEVLIPLVDQQYRTKPLRENRAIGGLSRGAGWALHLGFSHWESFGAIGMHSLPVFWTDLPEIRTWLDAIPYPSLPRIYMDLGDKDRPQISKSAIWFEELLTEMRIPHEWHLYPGYHEEAYWEEHIEEYLRWYTKNW